MIITYLSFLFDFLRILWLAYALYTSQSWFFFLW